MIFELSDNDISFPHPSLANEDGLLAIGGDLSSDRLLNAYANGIFPWYQEFEPILWWSPNPRFVLFPNKFKAQKSLLQKIRNRNYKIRYDFDFKSIIYNCQKIYRKNQDGTWITNEMKEAFINLNAIGVAHSVEVYENNELIGGLYGVQIGTVFTGESMFSKKSDGSKIALYNLCTVSTKLNINLIDVQLKTPYLESLGAKNIPRDEFIKFLEKTYKKTKFEKWEIK